MSWTFNPPPGWPVSAGWQPPPGWTPEHSWPPAPAGWQFWVPAPASAPTPEPATPTGGLTPVAPGIHEAPTSLGYAPLTPPTSLPPAPPRPPFPTSPPPTPPYPAPPRPKPWHRRGWAAGTMVLSVVLVGCLIGGTVALVLDRDGGPSGDAGAAPEPAGPVAPGDEQPEAAPGLGPGQERSGAGPAIITLDLPADTLHTVTLAHSGEGVFHARLLDDAGEFTRGLGSGFGEFAGTYPLELRAYGEPHAVDIVEADGSWTVQIQPLSEAPLWPDQTTGSGAAVLQIDPSTTSTAASVSISHQGQSNVFVWEHVEGDYADLVVNEIGEYSGEVDLRAGAFVLEIDADGEWSIEPAS